uniref:Uncharacterized protein n=1 Tax=virus sp. ctL1g6 TaxID=2827988 RepID=A0A8S5RFD8_9VIRU|nr:MAG TPA: hypothetical protein [virus sp. ctL1g6]
MLRFECAIIKVSRKKELLQEKEQQHERLR